MHSSSSLYVYQRQTVCVPGLANIEDFDVGCIEPDNLTINTRSFCVSLQQFLERQGVQFQFSQSIEQVMTDSSSTVRGVKLSSGTELMADEVCAL